MFPKVFWSEKCFRAAVHRAFKISLVSVLLRVSPQLACGWKGPLASLKNKIQPKTSKYFVHVLQMCNGRVYRRCAISCELSVGTVCQTSCHIRATGNAFPRPCARGPARACSGSWLNSSLFCSNDTCRGRGLSRAALNAPPISVSSGNWLRTLTPCTRSLPAAHAACNACSDYRWWWICDRSLCMCTEDKKSQFNYRACKVNSYQEVLFLQMSSLVSLKPKMGVERPKTALKITLQSKRDQNSNISFPY